MSAVREFKCEFAAKRNPFGPCGCERSTVVICAQWNRIAHSVYGSYTRGCQANEHRTPTQHHNNNNSPPFGNSYV